MVEKMAILPLGIISMPKPEEGYVPAILLIWPFLLGQLASLETLPGVFLITSH